MARMGRIMDAITTKLNLLKLENLNSKEFKIYTALLGLNKSVNETNADIYYTIGQFVSKSITLNNGDFAKSITPNKLINILYSYFKSENKKYPLRLKCHQNKKSEWVICSCSEERASAFYASLETSENIERLEKSAQSKEKAKAKAKETSDNIKAIATAKNLTTEQAKEEYKKEVEKQKRLETLASFTDAELLDELLRRNILDNSDIELLKKRIAENAEIA